ncbi:MAG: 16S rRNA (cytosine(1402)-N(4))-methyltransferase RsmH [Campylobacter sp.]|nr:16S rRNA (cytosine(1402)-N(4))-methyltransferase RsmH [Campylobacter sp.]
MQIPHIPVLYNEVLEVFKSVENGVIIDCTLGYGGHSNGILKSNPNVNLIACDRDDEAISFSKNRLSEFGDRVQIYKSNFSQILNLIDTNSVRGILADIGVSSLQIDKNERGFGLQSDELDMRMDKTSEKDAKFVLNSYSKDELTRIFNEYGELANSHKIADKIVAYRTNKTITSAKELVSIVGNKSVKGRSVSEAILVFQAIRIEVNDELAELTNLLDSIENSKINKAKVAIISFHSLEDRIVKNRFKKWEKNCICPDFFIKCECGGNHALGRILSKKAITASKDELRQNSRASSAKMRVFEIDRKA